MLHLRDQSPDGSAATSAIAALDEKRHFGRGAAASGRREPISSATSAHELGLPSVSSCRRWAGSGSRARLPRRRSGPPPPSASTSRTTRAGATGDPSRAKPLHLRRQRAAVLALERPQRLSGLSAVGPLLLTHLNGSLLPHLTGRSSRRALASAERLAFASASAPARRIRPRQSVVRKMKRRARKPSTADQAATAICWPTE
jgi:hypothetical protein